MEVYTLVGPSGSGKSHRARMVAHEHNIPLILDDGLLISEGRILAGSSAKRESSKLAAIKRAVMAYDDHRRELKRAIEKTDADKILILGTSQSMVEKITARLELGGVDHSLNISELASEDEIEQARKARSQEGTHVIPVPTIEVRRRFLGFFIDSLSVLFSSDKDKEEVSRESSIVRARFTYFGNLIVYNQVIADVIYHISDNFNGIEQVRDLTISKKEEGLFLTLYIRVKYGLVLPDYLEDYRWVLANELESFTGINVPQIDINVVEMEVD
ncbi:hypothetical protein [Halarsenatibacter silvermanii]|uniref:Asp23 family, cell envelope-related function n=1 Tax=Halarsenatibacter silvermanii TaxID=321763 RepID=A0A1G9I8Y5_9FIRM|nr:hypothetical protein [Halarsenatibacter silvermanii]SDL21546.1 hypothetical protein SAMN04488692_102144 [Halarsenatibacter silvermanii]